MVQYFLNLWFSILPVRGLVFHQFKVQHYISYWLKQKLLFNIVRFQGFCKVPNPGKSLRHLLLVAITKPKFGLTQHVVFKSVFIKNWNKEFEKIEFLIKLFYNYFELIYTFKNNVNLLLNRNFINLHIYNIFLKCLVCYCHYWV